MSDQKEGEGGHPQGVKPPKSSSREEEGFINSYEQMKSSSLHSATKPSVASNDVEFAARQDETPQFDAYYDSSHLDQTNYFASSASSSRPYSQPFPSPYSQPAAAYSQTSNFSRGVQSARSGDPYFSSLGAYDLPSARGLSGQGGMNLPSSSMRYRDQWQSSLPNMSSFEMMEHRIADMERRQRDYLASGKSWVHFRAFTLRDEFCHLETIFIFSSYFCPST